MKYRRRPRLGVERPVSRLTGVGARIRARVRSASLRLREPRFPQNVLLTFNDTNVRGLMSRSSVNATARVTRSE